MTTRRVGAGWGPTEQRAEGDCTFFRGGEGATGDLDTIFDVLSNRRRRIVLEFLRDRGGEWVPVEAIAEQVTAWEVELVDPASVTVESIEIDIAHGHLPKLDDAGVVAYDRDERRASYCGTDRIERFLDLAGREGPLP